MKRRIIRSIVVVFTLLPLAAISAPATTSSNEAANNRSACSSAWSNSYASLTCRYPNISTSGNFCYITAKCGTSEGRDRYSSINAHISDVTRLNNCDGNLKVGGC